MVGLLPDGPVAADVAVREAIATEPEAETGCEGTSDESTADAEARVWIAGVLTTKRFESFADKAELEIALALLGG